MALPPDPHRLIVAQVPARYRPRPNLVVDCSAIAAAIFGEALGTQAQERFSGADLHAPALIDIEMASVALKKLEGPDPEAARIGLASFTALAIRRHPVNPIVLLALAERYSLTAYDAAYLAVASELRVPLITFDRRLGAAARQHLGTLD